MEVEKITIKANEQGEIKYYVIKKGRPGIKFGSISSTFAPNEELEIVVERGCIILEDSLLGV